jgi:hypothetical protein
MIVFNYLFHHQKIISTMYLIISDAWIRTCGNPVLKQHLPLQGKTFCKRTKEAVLVGNR